MNMRKFKQGDRVKCINRGSNLISNDKVYKVLYTTIGDDGKELLGMLDDDGCPGKFYSFRFVLIGRKINHLPEWL